MIPFTRMLKYGSEHDYWYTNTLVAFDMGCLTGDPSTWTDYNGIPLKMGSGAAGSSSLTAYPGSPFGIGILLKNAGVYWDVTASGFSINNFITSDWTIDYYTCQVDAYVYNATPHLYPLAINAPFSAIAAANRVLLAYGGGNRPGFVHVWNNSGAPIAYSTWGTQAYYGQNIWQHHAVTYSHTDGVLKFFKDGVYQGSVLRTLVQPGTTMTASIRTPDNATWSAAIDRYRMRAGIHYNE